ncbi:MAG: DNA mismatch repair endonuclease MutL [Elusimicrobiaceae bacterium]|nr:DNA mismatch repair endonuclease MutL [Elusimicrobiaceae bacterium]
MGKIHVLDEKTAGKIAAGEVIERPAGVLKELLENAVDAGASSIRVDIEGSGKELIRIHDNGCGMDADDLAASVLRHATSKIQHFDDLEQLQTFGFRGEALYSVAAVSRMTLTSCTAEGPGSRLEIHGGKVVAESPAPAVQGTTIEIRDLFYNTPARLKFLKSDSYERACLLKVIEESALANLTVGYRVYINGREIYDLPAQKGAFPQGVAERAKVILGQEVADSLLAKKLDEMGLELLITPADKLVTVRDMQYVFVNRRPIDSKTIQQAVYKAYQNVRPKDRHPAFLIYLTLQPGECDVNIHPQKRDIRFVNENRVFSFIMQAVGETIFQNSRPVETAPFPAVALAASAQPAADKIFAPSPAKLGVKPSGPTFAAPIWGKKPAEELRETEDPVPYNARPEGLILPSDPKPDPEKQPLYQMPQPSKPLPKEQETPSWFEGPYHYLGQLQKSYLLFENPSGLVLIDQHAAQERVLFEHYLEAFEKRKVEVQKLLFPLHVDLPPSNAETLLSWAPWLKTAGFELAPFSARTVLVHTRPHMIRFKEDDLKEFIVSLSQLVGDPAKSTETLKRKMVAMLACKKAVKAHDALSAAEAEALLENMKKCKDGMHCPHGRPCVAQVQLKDIDKLFGR